MATTMNRKEKQGLYDPQFEHDSCGVGFIVNIDGRLSHDIITDGLTILKNLVHRGAIGGDMKTGDGAGMLIQIPHVFFERTCKKTGFSLPAQGAYGIGFFFLPQNQDTRLKLESSIEYIIKKEGCAVLGWRDVPVLPGCLGELALSAMPFMRQLFIGCEGLSGDSLERKLYVVRKCIEQDARDSGFSLDEFYIPSLSSRTITYKGMFDAPLLEMFYLDFADPDFQSSLAVIHQRYSTNTFPSWPLAQPFRYLA
ncbi:MAG: glutamate synthase subunit alpha, partial [Pseudomonadota bacterium]